MGATTKVDLFVTRERERDGVNVKLRRWGNGLLHSKEKGNSLSCSRFPEATPRTCEGDLNRKDVRGRRKALYMNPHIMAGASKLTSSQSIHNLPTEAVSYVMRAATGSPVDGIDLLISYIYAPVIAVAPAKICFIPYQGTLEKFSSESRSVSVRRGDVR